MNLVEKIYKLTNRFPKEEIYSLSSQMRRCSVSVPSNIAEGFMQVKTLEKIYISLGSLGELDTQIEISKRLKYTEDSMEKEIEIIRKQLYSLIKTLKDKL